MTSIKNNISEIEFYNSLVSQFKDFYPDINPDNIDNDLLQNMLENINDHINNFNKNNNIISNDITLNNTNISNNTNIPNQLLKKEMYFNETIISENNSMAYDIIPEMLIKSNLIYLKGKMGGKPINIMIDTGASCCFTYSSVIRKCGLEYLIDTKSQIMIMGAHNIKPTLGTIWFVEIELNIGDKTNSDEKFVSIPISIEVNDDKELLESENKINMEFDNNIAKLKEIAYTNKKLYDIEEIEKQIQIRKNSKTNEIFDLILGINFLQSYGANIDFSTKTITLNKTIKIKFN